MVVSVGLIVFGELQFCDGNGKPLAGGSVTYYTVGTSTLAAIYTDSTGAVEAANPQTLDAAGRATAWGVGTYRQVVQDALGNTIWDTTTEIFPQNLKITTLEVTGDAKVGGTLEVDGATTLNGSLTVGGTTVLDGNLSVGGAETVAGGLAVTGNLSTSATPADSDDSTRVPNTSWFYTGALAAVATALGFVFSKASPGYIKLPSFLGGLIIQWGEATVSGTTNVYFPLVFPTAALGLVVGEANAGSAWTSDSVSVHGYNSLAANGYVGQARNWSGSSTWVAGTNAQAYLAIGY
jgi:hypothetical protein